MAASLLAPALVFLVVVGCGARTFDGQLQRARLEVERQEASCVDLASLFQGWTSSLDDRFRAFEYTHLASSSDRVVTRVVLDPERCRRICPAVEPERAYFQLKMREASGALRRCSLQHVLE